MDSRLESLNINPTIRRRGSASSGHNIPASSPGPSPAPQINNEVKARLLAFQMKRSKPAESSSVLPAASLPGTPSGSPSASSSGLPTALPSSSSSVLRSGPPASVSSGAGGPSLGPSPNIPSDVHSASGSGHSGRVSTVDPSSAPSGALAVPASEVSAMPDSLNSLYFNKPLPSLPPSEPFRRSNSATGIANFAQSADTGLARSASMASQPPAYNRMQTVPLSKKASLSQRRGLRLNMPDPASPSASASPSGSGPLTSTNSELASNPPLENASPNQQGPAILRGLSNRRNFRLNLDNTSLDIPSKANSGPASLIPSPSATPSSASHKPQLQGLFANYSKYVDIKSGSLNFAGKASLHSKGVDFLSGLSFRISLDQLEFVEELGHGNYGSVLKVIHKPTGVLMAMKEVRLELDEQKFTQILMELEILHNCDSPYIVDFYGAFFVEGAVYMCMEYMDAGSLDNIYGNGHGITDEPSLAYIAESIIRGLKELKDTHNIIHRDIKPTNILVNTHGKIKLCDFGVLGNLVASLAKTNIGCQSYMAPERIRGVNPDDATYLVQLDVWSLGLTLLEVAAGHYPYPGDTYGNIFSQLSAIVDGEPPRLDTASYSKDAQAFVRLCLAKNPKLRPSYAALLNGPWLTSFRGVNPRLDELVSRRVEELQQAKPVLRSNSNPEKKSVLPVPSQSVRANPSAPALHRGGLALNNRTPARGPRA